MRHFLAKLICLFAAITIMEAPTVVLQSYAWANMLSQRIPSQGISEAVSTTFDGAHPCELCLTAENIHRLQTKESKNIPTKELTLSGLKSPQLPQAVIELPTGPLSHFLCFSDSKTLPHLEFYAETPSPPPRAT